MSYLDGSMDISKYHGNAFLLCHDLWFDSVHPLHFGH